MKSKYVKATLIILCTGTWRTTEDLLDNNEAYAATLANFVATDDCPAALIESLKEAKKRFDKKKGKPAKRYRVSPNNASQFDYYKSQSTQASSQNSWSADLHLGRALMRDIAEQHSNDINDPHAEQTSPNALVYSGLLMQIAG